MRLEQEGHRLPANLSGSIMERIAQQEAQAHSPAPRRKRVLLRWTVAAMAVAASVAIALIAVLPSAADNAFEARYQGSYVVMDGRRITDVASIRDEISDALIMAEQAEQQVRMQGE